MYPMRRMVTTGADKPSNMRLMFGAEWREDDNDVKALWQQCRMEVLMPFRVGSSAQALAQALDEGGNRWTPRAPSGEEEEYS